MPAPQNFARVPLGLRRRNLARPKHPLWLSLALLREPSSQPSAVRPETLTLPQVDVVFVVGRIPPDRLAKSLGGSLCSSLSQLKISHRGRGSRVEGVQASCPLDLDASALQIPGLRQPRLLLKVVVRHIQRDRDQDQRTRHEPDRDLEGYPGQNSFTALRGYTPDEANASGQNQDLLAPNSLAGPMMEHSRARRMAQMSFWPGGGVDADLFMVSREYL